MLALRIIVGLGLAYLLLRLLAWRSQDRLAFPAPRAKMPDPKRVGVEKGEGVELVSGDGTKLVGWYLRAVALHRPSPPSPALLWFYGNGETVAAIWPIVREFQPPGTAVLVLDYPGYGGSGGRATGGALYAPPHPAYAALTPPPAVDPRRIYVYGPSPGRAAAADTAAPHPTTGTIRSRVASKRRSASSSVRSTTPSSPSANLQLCATRPVARRTMTSARVTSQRSTSGSVCPATSSSSNSGRLHSSPST